MIGPESITCRRDRRGRRGSARPDATPGVVDADEVEPAGGAVGPPRRAARPSSSRASSSGGRSTIVPTSVRTMWRRKLSAAISSSSTSPRRFQARLADVRTNTSCWVSVGVNARKSCSPSRSAADSRSARLVERPREPPAAVRLERRTGPAAPDAVAVAAAAGRDPCVEARRRLLRGDDGDVVRQDCVERLGRPRRPAARPRRRCSRRSRARGRPCRSAPATARPSQRGKTASKPRRAARPRRCVGRAGAPSRGRPCRRTRRLA